jgi:DNA-binding transcriptional regulator YiaG
MGKVESVLKTEIARLSRRALRPLISKSAAELRRLRQRVSAMERELKGLKAARAEDRIKAKIETVAETASGQPAPTARLSPRLIRTLRRRLNLSQAELARLVGVSTVAVGLWESGSSRPKPQTRARIVALRSLGRREARRLLEQK